MLVCQPGFEALLALETTGAGFPAVETGAGWVRTAALPGGSPPDLAFAHEILVEPVEITGDSVNALAAGLASHFFATARTERFEEAWPLRFAASNAFDGLGRRMDAVTKAFDELLRKKMARVARLATPEKPRGAARVRGLFVYFVDFRRAFVAREAVFAGQRRMADDPLAPSRSYLKVEEAAVVLGRGPAAGETVVDLGAAPGGWSYSAARHGAKVIAVDNGPLKGGALDHPLIEHRREDAFRFEPPAGTVYDWLFCDLVEEPHHVLQNLIGPWLERRWCRRFVVNLKFGRVDPIALLRELRAAESPLVRHAASFRVLHLYHDREEFTVVGETRGEC